MDYTYTNLGIEYSFGIELRDQGEYGTRLPEDQIIPNAQESLEAVKVFIGLFIFLARKCVNTFPKNIWDVLNFSK